ncbi:hypothetical protein H1230_25720 [Paenibacillus sp. 19GGS1-52]|uniref:CLC_0170 family protein n=1 Tax=Paenibacillus sp. 19GGS1-52 TaxID=2758563 RepID=UPI001EFA7AB2|nr:CLC_0170 family protein [Paenibacillus sp. 19GGS1-52]ULO06377.1 hypothetical protein H1230_25720 [Paenibacillus sp. 19GGS1-52]
MINVYSYMAMVLLFSGLILLTIDSKIYSVNGWVREKKAASVVGWIYSALSLLVIIFVLFFM